MLNLDEAWLIGNDILKKEENKTMDYFATKTDVTFDDTYAGISKYDIPTDKIVINPTKLQEAMTEHNLIEIIATASVVIHEGTHRKHVKNILVANPAVDLATYLPPLVTTSESLAMIRKFYLFDGDAKMKNNKLNYSKFFLYPKIKKIAEEYSIPPAPPVNAQLIEDKTKKLLEHFKTNAWSYINYIDNLEATEALLPTL